MIKFKIANNTLCKFIVLPVLFFLLTVNNIHSASWYDYDWNYRKMITFTDSSDSIPSPQENFPALIKITDNDLKNNAKTNGFDILFTDSDGITKLSHEIELFESDTGLLVAWIKIPVLDTGTVIYMYYGNSADDDQQNVSDVWDDNFVGVYHMNDSTPGTIKDSSGTNAQGVKRVDNPPLEAIGKIGTGQKYQADTSFIRIKTQNFSETTGTISLWFYLEHYSSEAPYNRYRFFGHVSPDTAFQNRIFLGADYGGNEFYIGLGGNWQVDTSIFTPDTKAWYNVILVWNEGNYYVYKDGEQMTSGTYTGLNTIDTHADIGNTANINDRTYSPDGLIDEVQISNIARSDSWIKTSYHNQNDPANFFDTGIETLKPDIAILFPDDNYETNALNITVTGTLRTGNIGDTIEIFLGNDLQDSVVIAEYGDTDWSLNITLSNISDSYFVRFTDVSGCSLYDTRTIRYDTVPPDPPVGVDAIAILDTAETGVLLSWTHNSESDTIGYNIYRTSNPPDFSKINDEIITVSNYFFDRNVVQGETYFYKITCLDNVFNESEMSDSITASSVKVKLSVDIYGRTLPGDTLILYFNYYNDGFGPAYKANLFYNLPNNLIFDTFVINSDVSADYDSSIRRLQWEFNQPIFPKLESDSKNIRVILKIK